MNLRAAVILTFVLTFVALGVGGAPSASAAEQRRDPICIGSDGPVIVRVCTPT